MLIVWFEVCFLELLFEYVEDVVVVLVCVVECMIGFV